VQDCAQDAPAFIEDRPVLDAEPDAQDDVARDAQHGVVGPHLLVGLPSVGVPARDVVDGLSVLLDAAGVKSRRQQLALAAMALAVEHPDRSGAGEGFESRLEERVVAARIGGEDLAGAFRRQRHHGGDIGKAQRDQLAVAAAQPG
jgi:hypothetical protein